MVDFTTEFDGEPLTHLTVGDLLRNRAEVVPDDLALVYGPEDRRFTFRELNDTANAVANALLDLGVERQGKVSVMASNPLDSMRSMVGINKAGAVYSPINFEYRGSTLAYQLNDTAPELLVVEDRYAERLNEVADDLERLPHVVRVETDAESEALVDRFDVTDYEELFEGSTEEPSVDVSWHDEASIVYTSGTTGMPKGVVLPYRWIFANYTLFRARLLDADDVVHTSLPMYHVGGVYWDTHTAWVSGAPSVLWDRFSRSDFWDRVEAYGATTVTLVSVMSTWLAKQDEGDAANTLNKVYMQPLPENYMEMAERFGFDFVHVGFGQTESGLPLAAAIHAAQGEHATPEDVRRGKPPEQVVRDVEALGVPVVDAAPGDRYMGRPVDAVVELATLDEHDERADPQVPGELAVRPKLAGLMLKEYYGKPDRTVEALRNCWFHTGDAAYRDEEGNYFYVDREGDVIRRRGENISSLQIQEVTNTNETVAAAAAYPVPAEEGGEDEIALAVEVAEGATLTEVELRAYLADRLPEFMRPKYVEILAELPTTKTNKLEKYKLRRELIEREGLEG